MVKSHIFFRAFFHVFLDYVCVVPASTFCPELSETIEINVIQNIVRFSWSAHNYPSWGLTGRRVPYALNFQTACVCVCVCFNPCQITLCTMPSFHILSKKKRSRCAKVEISCFLVNFDPFFKILFDHSRYSVFRASLCISVDVMSQTFRHWKLVKCTDWRWKLFRFFI